MKIIKLIIKVIALLILIPIMLFSFVGYSQGDYGFATFFFLLGLIPSIFIIRSIIKDRRSKELIIQKPHKSTINIDEQNNVHSYVPMIIIGKGVQFLESMYVIGTTKNLDTLSGRISFVDSIYSDIIKASQFDRYISDFQQSIGTYKTRYYDRIITDYQMELLLYPDIDKIKSFYADCIVQCFVRYSDEQIKAINLLKRETAIQNRKENVIAVGHGAKCMFKTFDLDTTKGHLGKIENIRKQFYYQSNK